MHADGTHKHLGVPANNSPASDRTGRVINGDGGVDTRVPQQPATGGATHQVV